MEVQQLFHQRARSTAAVAWHAAGQRQLAGAVHGAVTALETAVEKLGAAFKE